MRPKALLFIPVLCLSAASVLAAPTVGSLRVSPDVVPLSLPTTVLFTVQISDALLISGSVNLQRLGADGKVIATLGVFRDDGTGGDAVAGDGVLAVQVQLRESLSSRVRFTASAAFRGSLKRVQSPASIVTVVGSGGLIGTGGGTIEVTDPDSALLGTTLAIPRGALTALTSINLSGQIEADAGSAPLVRIELSPSGTTLSVPATLTFPYALPIDADPALVRAAIYSPASPLRLGMSEHSRWERLSLVYYANGTVTVPVSHFSLLTAGWEQPAYTVLHLPGRYLQKGDLIYALALLEDDPPGSFDWFPGHAGLYVGTSESGDTSNDGETIIESTPDSVVLHAEYSNFRDAWYHIFMGARRHRDGLTDAERTAISEYALDQRGKPWDPVGQGDSGQQDSFSCVGLTEASYDAAGKSIIPGYLEFPAILPIQQYGRTVPVDTITLSAGTPMLPIPVRGVARDGDYWSETEAWATGVRTDLGMSFDGGELTWPAPVAGTYLLRFYSSGTYNGRNYTTEQDLNVQVLPGEHPTVSVLPGCIHIGDDEQALGGCPAEPVATPLRVTAPPGGYCDGDWAMEFEVAGIQSDSAVCVNHGCRDILALMNLPGLPDPSVFYRVVFAKDLVRPGPPVSETGNNRIIFGVTNTGDPQDPGRDDVFVRAVRLVCR